MNFILEKFYLKKKFKNKKDSFFNKGFFKKIKYTTNPIFE